MEWLNKNAGVVILIAAVLIVLLVALSIFLLLNLRNKIAVQRLKFLGFYSTDPETRQKFAKITIGNRSLNEVGISELGIKNGKVNFNLTPGYKEQKQLKEDTRIVIEQRSAINFTVSADELKKTLIDGKNGKKQLKTLRVYAVDLTGALYQGKVPAVKKLLGELKCGAPSIEAPEAEAVEESAETQE